MTSALLTRHVSADADREPADSRILERSDTVLWTLSSKGLLLHNFARHHFIELDSVGREAWGLLDGARSVDEVIARCCAARADTVQSSEVLASGLRALIATLALHGFIVPRVP